MIARNLGTLERIVRLLAGLGLLAWALQRPALDGIGWCVILGAIFLVMNGIFSRCYLWRLLGISTCDPAGPDCGRDPTCR